MAKARDVDSSLHTWSHRFLIKCLTSKLKSTENQFNHILSLAKQRNKMESHILCSAQKPHVVCVPYPAQGHINPMLKVAKLLHVKGFHVTFVNTVYNHNRLLRSRGPHALDGLPSFRFETIPDGLPDTDVETTQYIPTLCESTMRNCLAPFKELLRRLNTRDDVPPVSCILSDGCMSFTLDAAEELGVPEVLFWTTSACGFMVYLHFYLFIEKGLCPLKGMCSY